MATETYARGGPRPAPGTICKLFFDAVAKQRPDAMRVRVSGKYQPISHERILEWVRRTAFGLSALGVRRGDRVALLSENRPEWTITDFACLTSGAVDVPIYATLPPEHIAYILKDSGAVAIFVSTAQQAAKIAQIRAELPKLAHVICFDEAASDQCTMTFAALERTGAANDSEVVANAWRRDALSAAPNDLATIIYTSGTTGEPKGVMLSHDNIYSNVAGTAGAIDSGSGDIALSFLPLSHIFERMGDYWHFTNGVSIAYVESFDAVRAAMTDVRPTIVLSVPRLYEKMYAAVLENALSGGALKKRIFFWARDVALRRADRILAGKKPGAALNAAFAVGDKLVFSKLRARTGGRLHYFVSGGAPLSPEINKFFYAAGLTILEGYGLTETSPVIGVNTPSAFRIGTIGRPIAGVEVMIAPDGEILTRGPHVMLGYYNKPDATREAIDSEGWFHTGDIGELDDGFLRITDRKKDLIVTAAGKNIAPQPIENAIKTNKFVSQVVMIGDRRRHTALLVVPNFDQLEKWARQSNLTWTDRAQLIVLPAVQAKMEKEIAEHLRGLASYETPKRIGLLANDFSVESGELTPTLKVKRRVIDKNYKALIDELYAPRADDPASVAV
ncbi:MAG: AMP-dependent synthetase/ligase [Gemmatimonadaceae bacterium]